MITTKKKQYVVDQKGRRLAVLVDVRTYEKLMEAAEELEDIRAYDEAKSKIKAEIREGNSITLDDYLRKRKIKTK